MASLGDHRDCRNVHPPRRRVGLGEGRTTAERHENRGNQADAHSHCCTPAEVRCWTTEPRSSTRDNILTVATRAAPFALAVRGASGAWHRDGRGAALARRDNREYRTYLRAEQRRQRGCIARRMQRHLHHGLLGKRSHVVPRAAGRRAVEQNLRTVGARAGQNCRNDRTPPFGRQLQLHHLLQTCI